MTQCMPALDGSIDLRSRLAAAAAGTAAYVASYVARGSSAADMPVIGITTSLNTPDEGSASSQSVPIAYANAVADAGGTPILLPMIDAGPAFARVCAMFDALVIVGGGVISKGMIGAQVYALHDSSPWRNPWLPSSGPELCGLIADLIAVRFCVLTADIRRAARRPQGHGKQHRTPHHSIISRHVMLERLLVITAIAAGCQRYRLPDPRPGDEEARARSIEKSWQTFEIEK